MSGKRSRGDSAVCPSLAPLPRVVSLQLSVYMHASSIEPVASRDRVSMHMRHACAPVALPQYLSRARPRTRQTAAAAAAKGPKGGCFALINTASTAS